MIKTLAKLIIGIFYEIQEQLGWATDEENVLKAPYICPECNKSLDLIFDLRAGYCECFCAKDKPLKLNENCFEGLWTPLHTDKNKLVRLSNFVVSEQEFCILLLGFLGTVHDPHSFRTIDNFHRYLRDRDKTLDMFLREPEEIEEKGISWKERFDLSSIYIKPQKKYFTGEGI